MKNKNTNFQRGESNTLLTPEEIVALCSQSSEPALQAIIKNRTAINNIVAGKDNRLLIVVGPCSIHHPKEAIEYAKRLVVLRGELSCELEIVMRVYFEKPRTTVGWKGLINDPYLDNSFKINDGLQIARELLVELTEIGLPVACEFLDMITPQYIYDLVSWGAIGARTTESQIHRELASSLPFSIGFKNGTDGNVAIAVDGVRAASAKHHMLTIDNQGKAIVMVTDSNQYGHVILRGGDVPNYSGTDIDSAIQLLQRFKLTPSIMIDCSHGNSLKDYQRQEIVCDDICNQIMAGENAVMGLMIESNLVEGKQELTPSNMLNYGQSITDGCIGWQKTEYMLRTIAKTVSVRFS